MSAGTHVLNLPDAFRKKNLRYSLLLLWLMDYLNIWDKVSW